MDNLLKSRAFKKVKRALEKSGFKWEGQSGYLFFQSDKFYMRLEDYNNERFTVSISPRFAFDRWANSRHIQFFLYEKLIIQTEPGIFKTKFYSEQKIYEDIQRKMKDVNTIVGRLPQRLFQEGMFISI